MPAGLADLTVLGATLATNQAVVGTPLPVSWTVANQGTAATNASWEDAVYVSSSSTFNPATATLLTTVPAPSSLGVGASYTSTADLQLPSMAAGQDYLYFVANSNQDQSESSFANNVLPESISVVGGPDLTISATAPATEIVAGNNVSFPVSWTVTNNSAYDATASWSDNVYLSPTADYDASTAIPLGTFAAPIQGPLNAGSSYTAYQT